MNKQEKLLEEITDNYIKLVGNPCSINEGSQFAIYNPFSGRIEGYGTLEELKIITEMMNHDQQPIGLSYTRTSPQ